MQDDKFILFFTNLRGVNNPFFNPFLIDYAFFRANRTIVRMSQKPYLKGFIDI